MRATALRYAPFADPRQSRKPGLAPLDPATWIEVDGRYSPQMAYRERLIETKPETVLAEAEGSGPAPRELLDRLCLHLAGRPEFEVTQGTVTRPDGRRIDTAAMPALGAIGRLVQEDFCILEPGEGEYRLTAAVVCFPSRWTLAKKIGRPLTAIHAPVPDYTDDLARRVARIFEGVRVGAPLWRANWTVHDSPELHQPSGDFRASDGCGPLFVRVERQTFVRLPGTGAVVFGIRTFIDPLESLSAAQARALLVRCEALTEPEIAYRGGMRLHDRILTALRSPAADTSL